MRVYNAWYTRHSCSSGAIFIPLFFFTLNHLSLERIQLHKLLSKRDFFKLGFLTKDADRTNNVRKKMNVGCYHGCRLIIFIIIIIFLMVHALIRIKITFFYRLYSYHHFIITINLEFKHVLPINIKCCNV